MQGSSNLRKFLPNIFIFVGAAAIGITVAVELLGIGYPGFGPSQIMLAVSGIAVLATGIVQRNKLTARKLFAVAGPTVSSLQFLLIAGWLGLLTGFAEGLILGGRILLLDRVVSVNPHWFWMKPVADALLFVVIGLILLLVARRVLKVLPLRLPTCVFIFLGCVTLLFMFPKLHKYAALVFAAGMAMQISRLIAGHASRFNSFVRRTVPWFVALTAALFLGVFTWKVFPEHRAFAKLPPAKSGAPNVLLIVLDTVRAQSLSVYGYNRPTTPRLERFAKTGVCFERAFATSPWTLPSHATLFTGRFSHELFDDWETPLNGLTPVRARYPTLAETLSRYGYVTAGFVANVNYCGYSYGLNRGFIHYEDYVVSLDWFLGSSSLGYQIYSKIRKALGDQWPIGRKTAAEINGAFLHWLDRQERRPFFGFLNYIDAHDPYMPTEPFELKFGAKKPGNPYVRLLHQYATSEITELQDAYDSCIAYLDEQVGILLDELQRRGLHENTLVIITSDHGEHFGEHGLMFHGNSLYRALLHVPLLITFPSRLPAGKKVLASVSLRDLPATVIDLLEFENEVNFPGSSLAQYWSDADTLVHGELEAPLSEVLVGIEKPKWGHKSWPFHRGGMKSLVADRYHYIKNGDGSEELYNFETDPQEARNLTNSAEGQPLLRQFRLALETTFARSGRRATVADVFGNSSSNFVGKR